MEVESILGMVVTSSLVAALPFVLDRFAGSGALCFAVVIATFLLIAFVVDRVAPTTGRSKRRRPFRSPAASTKIPASSARRAGARPRPSASAKLIEERCRKAS
jgi:hypothetical protein